MGRTDIKTPERLSAQIPKFTQFHVPPCKSTNPAALVQGRFCRRQETSLSEFPPQSAPFPRYQDVEGYEIRIEFQSPFDCSGNVVMVLAGQPQDKGGQGSQTQPPDIGQTHP